VKEAAQLSQETKVATVTRHLEVSVAVKQKVISECVDSIVAAADLIAACFQRGDKLLICGNGGSAADAQHVAAEFVSRLRKEVERKALPAIALTTDTSFITAYANDYEWTGVFARQVEALGEEGDVLLCISTSGSSANVVRAQEAAQTMGLQTIALVGDGGSLVGAADAAVVVPSTNTGAVQESMLAIEHAICELVEDSLFGPPPQAVR
jgi:D-sedoheptulose 7-phosphate isomerase